MMLRRLARWIGLLLLAVIVVGSGGWSALAIWFRFEASEWVRGIVAGGVLVLTVVVAARLATPRRWIAVGAYAVLFAAMLGWWSTIRPSNDRDWQADV